MALEQTEKDALKAEIEREIENRLIERGDERYVMQADCNERQEAVNKHFADDDKRIALVSQDFGSFKKLMWIIASASVGSLIAAIFELIF